MLLPQLELDLINDSVAAKQVIFGIDYDLLDPPYLVRLNLVHGVVLFDQAFYHLDLLICNHGHPFHYVLLHSLGHLSVSFIADTDRRLASVTAQFFEGANLVLVDETIIEG